MIIAHGTDKETGEDVLILGLSEENIRRMKDGQPIQISQRSHGGACPKGLQIIIHTGETEEAMAQQYLSAKAVHPGQINVMPANTKTLNQ